MSKFERKIKRNKLKQLKKNANADIKQKMLLFERLGDHCKVCNEPFDKEDKEMVQAWYVVVRREQGNVNLYCPPCWEEALQKIKDIQEVMKDMRDPSDN